MEKPRGREPCSLTVGTGKLSFISQLLQEQKGISLIFCLVVNTHSGLLSGSFPKVELRAHPLILHQGRRGS
jgi:hypothetical protein